MRSEQEVIRAIDSYADTVRRICFVHLKSQQDTEDIFQEVFLKYVLRGDAFEDLSHEKAWFIRVTINACKDFLKSAVRRNTVSMDALIDLPAPEREEYREVLEAVLQLPTKYKDIVYLHYYEGYSAVEIAALLNKKINTVYTLLSRARTQLKSTLGGDNLAE